MKYNMSHPVIKDNLRNHWYILCKDPYLRSSIPSSHPRVIYRQALTLKNILAPSPLRRHQMKTTLVWTKYIYRYGKPRWFCCKEIQHVAKAFSFFHTFRGRIYNKIQSKLSSFVIYLIQCPCNLHYVGRITQDCIKRINAKRANIKKKICISVFQDNALKNIGIYLILL